MTGLRALILLGGEFPPLAWLKEQYRRDDLIIAADRGGLLATSAGLTIDILLGDFDSLPQEVSSLQPAPRQTRTFPCDKDFSDGELALLCAQERHCHSVLFLGALGGRLDHCLFNIIALLEQADNLGLEATVLAPDYCVFQLHAGQSRTLDDYRGYLCSLISLDAQSNVTISGLRYSHQGLLLERSSTRGLSNVVEQHSASVMVNAGRLLVVLAHPESETRH